MCVLARVALVPEIPKIPVGSPAQLLAGLETMLIVMVAVPGEQSYYLRAGSHLSASAPGAKGRVCQGCSGCLVSVGHE